MTEKEKLTKDNVLLIEKQNIITRQAIKPDDEKIVFLNGLRLFAVYKPLDNGFDVVAQYEFKTDSINLDNLKKYIGHYLVSVDIEAYNKKQLVWNVCQLLHGADDNKIFAISNGRQCTDEEVALLNNVFPNFYDECVKQFHEK